MKFFFGSEILRKEATISADTISETPLPENTGNGDEEVPLSHSLNFSSIVVFVRPSSSFSNSLLIFHPSSK